MTFSRLVPIRPSAVPPAATIDDVRRHLRGKLHGAVGNFFTMGNHNQANGHAAAPTAARRIRALEAAPGSRWPALRSPR